VAKECFNPKPKVESAIVRLIPKTQLNLFPTNEAKLSQVVMCAFNQRRKTINNSLKALIKEEGLRNLGIDSKKRAENLSVNEYIAIANYLT
jgi:16S rRNA (adenine1518-N6/adenine1519-N6)-dimethyltransferase